MSEKLIAVIVCLIMVLLTLKCENTGLGEAEARLISKMLENDRVAEVFSMRDGGVET